MNATLIDKIVETVLYEGYVLYPYRASSHKNQQRFTFGRIYPRIYSIAEEGAEPYLMQTECLIQTHDVNPMLNVIARFLHPVWRQVGRFPVPIHEASGYGKMNMEPVPEMEVDGVRYQSWHEAIERKIQVPPVSLDTLQKNPEAFSFSFPVATSFEPIVSRKGQTVAMYSRQNEAVQGSIELSAEKLAGDLVRLRARVLNLTPMEGDLSDQNAVLMHSFASAHTVLQVQGGAFLSLMDPPPAYKELAAGCKNVGTWPVLVGDEAAADKDAMLSSPIILYDYPRIAPESPGDLFDAAEIDEILTLRVQTLTDAEKQEVRNLDERVRLLLDRTESLGRQGMMNLHGTFRDPSPFDRQIFGERTPLQGVTVSGVYLRPGDRVRIHPKGRADIMDVVLDGKIGIIEAVEQDAEGNIHLPLVLEDDPGKDLGLMRQPGHRFFYSPEEIEPLGEGER